MNKTENKTITVAKGDGIGPEIMDAVLRILQEAKAPLNYDYIQIGESVYESGHTAGISPEAWDVIRKNKVLLKAPITTPQGKGYKSLNVSIRKTLGLFSNVRPCRSLDPYVPTKHPDLDVVIIRENEEDLYAGIEHQQTPEVVQCLKLISRPGCEKIVRYAFEYARHFGRKKVTCFSKDNIMKQTDGLFHQVFDEIASEYPDIENDHWIIDIGSARLADTPEDFDVIVTANLYGDVISDIAAQIAGSVGLAGSSNIGESCAMFEAIHGSAPPIAGQNIANPSGLLQGAILMLNHLNLNSTATAIQNAWLKTIEDGIHTFDIYREGVSEQKVSTTEFADAVIERLGQKPSRLTPVQEGSDKQFQVPTYTPGPKPEKVMNGIDLFVDWDGRDPEVIAKDLHSIENNTLQLDMVTNRGIKVYPNGFDETFCTDHWRCRFVNPEGKAVDKVEVIQLQQRAHEAGLDVVKTEGLYSFDGKRAYSLGQGQ
jgi:isocitrate dehydrogenase